ncbi:MAG TPA: methyltransferase [Cyclobacteriaceae bacterium]|nr:methyltransferase [Cyclobacteriaceae bacterium]
MQFKRFTVRHDRVAMKVGMDGVLLGAWTSVEQVGSILDVGTGSGVIALMLAQRTPASVSIDAVEISDDIHQAAENFNASPWKQRLRALHMPVQDLNVQVAYDLVVTNPPYYANALKPPDPARQRARHDRSLRHEEIVTIANRLLTSQGRLSLILPSDAAQAFETTAARHGLYASRVCDLHSTPAKPPIRRLMEFKRTPAPPHRSSLCLVDPNGHPSGEYRSLVADFYLNF